MTRLAALSQVVLLISAAKAAWGRSFLTYSARSASFKPCTCDCCLVQQEYHAARSKAADSLKCAPRVGEAPGGAAGTGDGGCADICMLTSDDMRTSFKSQSGEADYSRYCMEQCGPATTTLNDLCVDLADIDPGEEAKPEAAPKAVHKKENAMTQMSSEVASQTAASNDAAMVLLAKQKMQAARLSAEAAGRAAYTARMAYERLKRTKKQLAVRAAEATLNEIKAEAAQQSKKARDIRLAYVNGAQATAVKNAQAAASVYGKALVRDLGVANIWQERSGQYATAANQREEMAMGFSEEAELYRKQNRMDRAKERMIMAHQAIDQAAAFGAQSEAAHKQAQAIADSKTWYEYAKKAIAAFILAKSMPGDVAPPPMPAIS